MTLHIELRKDEHGSKASRLFEHIKTMILRGELTGGSRLPPSRTLAADLRISRTVVLEAYDRLYAEGFTEAKTGSGTRVAYGLRLTNGTPQESRKIPPAGFLPVRTDIPDFRSGIPDLSRFPFTAWRAVQREVWKTLKPLDLSYSSPEGRPELRASIAEHLFRFRGIRCSQERIVITAGTTQAIGIISRTLLGGENRTVFTEDPLTRDIGEIIRNSGGAPVPVPVDASGIPVHAFPADSVPRFMYVTPSHQFPTGTTMAAGRRIELVEYAERTGAYIVEDDYDSEFRYDTPPVGTLAELCPERVIYIGTFSKTLFPSIRTAYIVFPSDLIGEGRIRKWESDLHNNTIDQLILSRFMDHGHYARHVAAMKRLYGRKRTLLLEALRDEFGKSAIPLGSPTGLHMTVRFPGADFTSNACGKLEECGVKVYPVEFHCAKKGLYRDCIILGFGMLSSEAIRGGIKILRENIRHCMERPEMDNHVASECTIHDIVGIPVP